MVEIHIPKDWSYNASVGVWEDDGNSTGKHNELYLSKFKGKTPLRFDVDSVTLRIRSKGSMPMQMTCKGIVTVMPPIRDNVVNEDPTLAVIDGTLVWV